MFSSSAIFLSSKVSKRISEGIQTNTKRTSVRSALRFRHELQELQELQDRRGGARAEEAEVEAETKVRRPKRAGWDGDIRLDKIDA